MEQSAQPALGTEEARCKNCDALLHGPYCAQCGQRRLSEGDRRLGHLLGQFAGALVDLDSRFWRSFRALLFRPGRLSRDYIDGRRVRWLAPATIFVLVNVLYFLAPALTDFSLPFSNQVPGHLAAASMPDQSSEASQRAREQWQGWSGQWHSAMTASWVERRIERRNAQRLERSGGNRGYSVADYARSYDARVNEVSKLLIVLHVPLIALALLLLFWRRRLYYAEHFVVALHLFAFLVLLIQLTLGPTSLLAATDLGARWLLVSWQWLGLAGLALVLLYFAAALRRVYSINRLRALLASIAVLFAVVLAHFIYRAVQFLVIFAIT